MPFNMGGFAWKTTISKSGIYVQLKRISRFYPNAEESMSFFDDDTGQGLVEYALVLLLVAVVVIAILVLLGPEISEGLCPYISLFCVS